jgi:hypothetical protein
VLLVALFATARAYFVGAHQTQQQTTSPDVRP